MAVPLNTLNGENWGSTKPDDAPVSNTNIALAGINSDVKKLVVPYKQYRRSSNERQSKKLTKYTMVY